MYNNICLLVLTTNNHYHFYFFFLNDPAPTEIYTRPYTLSLHDALPISPSPIHSWRSRREPSAPLESLRWKHLSKGRPTIWSNCCHTSSIAPATSYPAAWRWAVSRQNPTRGRTAAGSASRSAPSSSNVDPSAVPAPAVPSISSPPSSGAAVRQVA